MRAWWKQRKEAQQIESDAQDLIVRFGDLAYDEARQRHEYQRSPIEESDLPARTPGHWGRVRSEIARRTGRNRRVDTATRYLEDD
jgi:hypothetical protein